VALALGRLSASAPARPRRVRGLDDQHADAAGRARLIGDKSPSIGYSVSYPFGVIGRSSASTS
jgi:hypothetical protein